MSHQPLTLYRYRSLAEPFGRDTALNIIRHNRMWWQSPSQFNDPFDCNPVFVFGTNERDRKAFAKRAAANHLPGMSRQARLAKKRELLSRPNSHHEELVKTAFAGWMSESSVLCFSEVNDSPLMWSHYADCHRGACFIFREQFAPEPWISFDVTYSAQRPLVDITSIRDIEVFNPVVLHKASDWAYEKEHRMIEYRGAPGMRGFPPSALVGVIYGARMSAEDRRFMDELVSEREGVSTFQAALDEKLFRVNVSPMP